jgi:Protein of unknown function (DUF2568)
VMGTHPANLVIRFILEMMALFAMGYWGWQQREDLVRYLLAVLVPLVAASLWGLFAVPGDASRSGSAPVAVSGAVRLVVEVAFFTFGVFTAHQAVNPVLAVVLTSGIALHYAVSYDRIIWLLRA